MSESLDHLKIALRDLPQETIQALLAEVGTASGQGAVAIARDATGAVIVTGSDNIVGDNNSVVIHQGTDVETLKQIFLEVLALQGTYFYGLPDTQPKTTRQDSNEKILIAAVWTEVEDRLRQSLHNAILVRLDMAEDRTQVSRPWDSQLRTADRKPQALPPGTHIAEVFDRREVGGKLLILGNPGSGKTTTMLDLAAVLIQRANDQPEDPIPVMFNLSSWQKANQRIMDWLLEELKLKYGVSPKLGQTWLGEKKLLPLLDGLDELPPERQESVVQLINEWLQSGEGPNRLLVCSRREEYELYTSKLVLNGAICLEPLKDEQLQRYLDSLGMSSLWTTLQQDMELLDLVRTPLLLSVSVLANDSIDLAQWQQKQTTQERVSYLLDAYVVRRLHESVKSKEYPPGKQPTAKQTRYWLTWLAQQLHISSEDEFSIHYLQPKQLLKKSHQWQYWLILFISNSLLTWFIASSHLLHKMVEIKPFPWQGLIVLFIFASFTGGIVLSTESKHDGGILFAFLIAFPACFIFSIKIPEDICNNAPPLHRILLRFRIRRNLPTAKDLTDSIRLSWEEAKIIAQISFISIPIFSIFLVSLHELVIDISAAFNLRKINVAARRVGRNIKRIYRRQIEGKNEDERPEYLFLIISGIEYEKILRGNGGCFIDIPFRLIGCFYRVIFFIYFLFITIPQKLMTEPIKVEYKFNEAIQETLRTALLMTMLMCANILFVSKYDTTGILFNFFIPIILGFVVSLSFLPLAKHFALRLIFTFRIGISPWNYARFLNYCTERLLLQRVGGRYRFIHKLVQEHFAAMPLK